MRRVLLAFQIYTLLHVRSFSVAVQEDVLTLFERFLRLDLEAYEWAFKLAQEKRALLNPPVVGSTRI